MMDLATDHKKPVECVGKVEKMEARVKPLILVLVCLGYLRARKYT
jgi:hypothetical protein